MSKRYKVKRRVRYYRERVRDEPMLPVVDRCWCGVVNPYYAEVAGTCGGTGMLDCHCGGDLCVCHNHGETECFGCEDCEDDEEYESMY